LNSTMDTIDFVVVGGGGAGCVVANRQVFSYALSNLIYIMLRYDNAVTTS
jgi:hypothetical protein